MQDSQENNDILGPKTTMTHSFDSLLIYILYFTWREWKRC